MKAHVVELLLAVLLAGAPASVQEREALVTQGQALFREHGCYGCHTLGKSGTPIASDLSRLSSRYNESDLVRWLRDPSAQKPTAHMPKLQLTDAEIRALAAYLSSLR